MDDDELIRRYLLNPLTHAIVLGGLEPLDSFEEVLTLLQRVRHDAQCCDPVVIYTGYTEDEM